MAPAPALGPGPALIQSITIPRTESRSTPSPTHLVYAVLVTLPVRNWTVYRRYSEFLALHQSYLSNPPPAPFPPKHVAKSAFRALTVGLSGFLGGSNEEDILRERREALERYIKTIVASPDSTWRDADAFKDFIELPRSTPLSAPPPPSTTSSGNGSFASRTASAGAGATSPLSRQQQPSVPGSYHSTTRQLGQRGPAAVETEDTRPMDDSTLLSSQQSQFDRQDAQLDSLAAILRRQKQMGLAINQELVEQNELLDGLDGEVQSVQGKLKRNEGQIRKLG